MPIRVLVRMFPLFCVAIFTLAVFLVDTPLERARTTQGHETQRLAWAQGLVKCPQPYGNLPLAACFSANAATERPIKLQGAD